MTMCEKCWADAYTRSLSDTGKTQSEHYQDLLNERKDSPCSPTGETSGSVPPEAPAPDAEKYSAEEIEAADVMERVTQDTAHICRDLHIYPSARVLIDMAVQPHIEEQVRLRLEAEAERDLLRAALEEIDNMSGSALGMRGVARLALEVPAERNPATDDANRFDANHPAAPEALFL